MILKEFPRLSECEMGPDAKCHWGFTFLTPLLTGVGAAGYEDWNDTKCLQIIAMAVTQSPCKFILCSCLYVLLKAFVLQALLSWL